MNDFFIYLKRPFFIADGEISFFQSIKYLVWAYILCMAAVLITGIAMGIIHIVLLLLYEINLVHDIFSNQKQLSSSLISPVLYIILIGPFIEEIVFRLFLNLRKLTIATSIAFLFYAISYYWIDTKYPQLNICLRIISSIGIAILIYKLIDENLLTVLQTKYFGYIFYITAILFGIVHLSNFSPISAKIISMAPLLVLPQICYGLVMGYLRLKLKNGFIWALALHIFINGTAQLVVSLFKT